jgi:hypothetical protein
MSSPTHLGPRVDRYEHQVALFLALEGVADQPDQRWPQANEQGPALGVAALVLVDRLGADPQRDAEPNGTEREVLHVPGSQSGVVKAFCQHGTSWLTAAAWSLAASVGRPYHGSNGSERNGSIPNGWVVTMPKRPRATRRWLTAASWDYMWRTTPMHRQEVSLALEAPLPVLLSYPSEVSSVEVQGHEDGSGPLFHRLYRTRIRESPLDGPELMEKLQADLNLASPTKFARFQRLLGEQGRLAVGDEYVVRMPGPWDGPVRVINVTQYSFRLATLTGHLEAGQIEFRVTSAGTEVVFEIESWARSGSPLVDLLYHRLRMAKEVQAHMWISFLERVVQLAGGHMTGGIDLATERVKMPTASS